MNTMVQLESFSSIFNQSLQKHLLEKEEFTDRYNLVVLNTEKLMEAYVGRKNENNKNIGLLKTIQFWVGLNRFLEKEYKDLNGEIVNIQSVSWWYVFVLPFLQKHFKRIVLSFWGSDILRVKRTRIILGKRLFDHADVITFISDDMIKRFVGFLGDKYSNRIRKADFGSEILDYLDASNDTKKTDFKRKYGITDQKKCLVIGYNRHKEQQHIEAVRSILHADLDPSDIVLVFPWTYGPDDPIYQKQIEDMARDKFEYVFLKTELNNEEVACLRAATDILVQTQITDALSSSMLETLYAEKDVITGRWLHYDELERRGVQLHYVDSVNEVGLEIQKVMNNPLMSESKKHNKEIIRDMISWDVRIHDWLDIYLSE